MREIGDMRKIWGEIWGDLKKNLREIWEILKRHLSELLRKYEAFEKHNLGFINKFELSSSKIFGISETIFE